MNGSEMKGQQGRTVQEEGASLNECVSQVKKTFWTGET